MYPFLYTQYTHSVYLLCINIFCSKGGKGTGGGMCGLILMFNQYNTETVPKTYITLFTLTLWAFSVCNL